MHQCKLSENAKTYLEQFREILQEMEQNMTCPELTDSISHNFIVQMIPHHRAAIEMSRNILRYTTCPALERIAQNIITEQTESICQMEETLSCCANCCNTEEALCRYSQRFRCITETMFRRMGSACGTNCLNADFIREMIPHHQGAIAMSENAQRFPICPELQPILESIIGSQKRGVREMQRLLRCM